MNLAITGASGNIGGMVARHLNTRRLPLILPLRNPAKAPDLPNCEARRFAYGDLELAKQALNRVDVLFMVSAAESPTREQEHLTLVQAALEAGVKHIVYLSFAQAARDVAQAAANVIADIACGNHRHDNQTYTLTGSQALNFAEIAAVLTEITGKPHRYHNETLEEAFASRKAAYPDTPDWQIEAWVSTYTAIAKGELAAVSDDLPKLLEREPHRFVEVVESIFTEGNAND